MLIAFIKTCEPKREHARPVAQIKQLVDAFTKPGIDIMTPEDLAEVSADDLKIESPGLRAFARIVVSAAVKTFGNQATSEKSDAMLSSDVLAGLNQLLPKKPEPKHVDVYEGWKSVCTSALPKRCTPCGKAVDDLANEIEATKKKGVEKPFIFCDLHRFLPDSFRDHAHDAQQGDDEEHESSTIAELRKVMGISKKAKKPLTFVQWLAAYEQYTIAASITKQLDLGALMAHKAVCLGIAHKAVTEGRRKHSLAVLYDELARHSWSRSAYSNEPNFDKGSVKNRR